MENYLSTRLPYANKKIREIWMSMVTTNNNSTEDMIDKLQQLKGKKKSKFSKNISNYDEMSIKKFRFEEDTFAKNAQGVSKSYHEALLSMKLLQTKPQRIRILSITIFIIQ